MNSIIPQRPDAVDLAEIVSPLTVEECNAIAEILGRRSNDVATFQEDVEKWTGSTFREFPGSVEMALTREVHRLRDLERRVREVGNARNTGGTTTQTQKP